MDKTQKFLIRKLKKDYYKAMFSLDNTKVVLLTILLMIASFVLSYKLTKEEWFSQLTLAIGTGILTGLIFYFLSNVRANNMGLLQKEVNSLRPIIEEYNNINGILFQLTYKNTIYYPYDEDWNELFIIAKYSLHKLYDSLNRLPFTLCKEIDIKKLNKEFLEEFESATSEEEFLKYMKSCVEIILPIFDKAQMLSMDRELKISILNKKIF